MFSHRTLILALGGALALTAVLAGNVYAQALPTPKDLVTGIDLECYKTTGPALNINVNLTHLNPVLVAMGLPAHQVTIRELAQTCVPVRKNNGGPLPPALPFVRHIDFACYKIDTAPLQNQAPLVLTHLNPELSQQPQHNMVLHQAVQLCVPVAKNNVMPPAQVLSLVQFIDLECYEGDPAAHPQFSVVLNQLNPQLVNLAAHEMALATDKRQLCVPVRKNNQAIPQAVLERIRWIDLEKFKANQNVFIQPTNLVLNHLNPLFANQPPVPVTLIEANSLMVPVAKNNQIPPSD